ncbi:hypothetical protein DSO57_1014730 [Entomophthora muscae]|uniref:Uncharacterized protein n=1 Tax=Entomophthora muscae TaxID=34485 RepID=A0ACC2U3P8_9FUNG|nr:hypothetical protein DSO57_1014730 [Entomophthora muscae]
MILNSATCMGKFGLPRLSLSKSAGNRAYASVWPDTFGWVHSPTSTPTSPASSFSTDRKQSVALNDELLKKYKEKLAKKAKQEGVSSIEELIKKHTQSATPHKSANPEAVATTNPIQKDGDSTPRKLKKSSEKLGGSLSKIMKVEFLVNETPESISQIWTTHHIDKECLSAVVPGATYKSLLKKIQKCPQFLIPLPREEGHEFYFMQTHFHQIYFTSLLEYKTHGSQARPHLILTHYPELLDSKDIVLMRGDLGNDPSDFHGRIPLSLPDAKLLVYLFQQFYITGGPEKQKLVEVFNTAPSQFDHQKLLEEADKIN